MVVFNVEDESIELCKGDNGSIAFSLSNYELTDGDVIEICVKELDYKKFASFDRGYAFFNFDEKETLKLKEGNYKYDFHVTTKNIARTCLLHQNNFTVKGCCNGL